MKGESGMEGKLLRIGTTYLPVSNVEISSEWYVSKLGAILNYRDEDKAILNFANQSVFLVKAEKNQSANFINTYGEECFSITFEVDGVNVLEDIHREFKEEEMRIGEIENRGHSGRNFVFYDPDGNKFDVWSELSPKFKESFFCNEGK